MKQKQRVVIIGAGFAGFNAARELAAIAGTTEIVVINSTDYFLYLPLMPQVSGGLVEPRHICASLQRHLPKARFILGTVDHVDPATRTVSWATPAGAAGQITYDRLILTAGSVNKLLPIPGVAKAMPGYVHLSTGEDVPTQSLIWCVGVRPDRLVGSLGLQTIRGRLAVDEFMSVPDAPGIYACGDCAAVPDLTRPGEICGMTAQHAQQQGKRVARNVAASLGIGTAQPYRHHDLGFLVDLGGSAASANPLGIPLSGPPASLVTRAYHLGAMTGNRARILTDWILNVAEPSEPAAFGWSPPEPWRSTLRRPSSDCARQARPQRNQAPARLTQAPGGPRSASAGPDDLPGRALPI